MSAALLIELEFRRQRRLKEASTARHRHRGTAQANRRAIRATNKLLQAEIRERRRGIHKRVMPPDLFGEVKS